MNINSILSLCCIVLLGVPVVTEATVGISPSAAEVSLAQNWHEDRSLIFMRDEADTAAEMDITVFSDSGFLVTEGVRYHMAPGERELKIPYRVNTETYAPGRYEGILYIRPERIERTSGANGVRVVIQGGVRVGLTVQEETRAVPWYARSVRNMREHVNIYWNIIKSAFSSF